MVNLWKPWYVYRPTQVVRRIAWSFKEPQEDAVFDLPWGARLRANARKTIGRSLAQTGVYDLATSEVLYRLIESGDKVADVGANIGYMTVLMAHRAGPNGTVHAFEPHPLLFENLSENIARHRATSPTTKVVLHRSAVTDSRRQMVLVCPNEFQQNDGVAYVEESATGVQNSHEIDAVALDEALKGCGQIALLKIDIEGHELQAFRGATHLLRDSITHVVFEDHVGCDSAASEFLRDIGFTILQFGWTLRGLRLADAGSEKLSRRYEAPNFIATKKPIDVIERCKKRGWQVLRG